MSAQEARTPPLRFLLYATLSYSFPVLRPIQAELQRRGHRVAWFLPDRSEAQRFLRPEEERLPDADAVMAFDAHALIAPGNKIPSFFPGIKVQVFHGFDSGKKGKFRIRGTFDLYCTQGPLTTRGFEAQRERKGTFEVRETGWSKLDSLFTPQPAPVEFPSSKKLILYAPTFSPRLTSTGDLLPEIQRLSQGGEWNWLVKLHPKATQEEARQYKALDCDALRFVETDAIVPLLQAADVLLSDTSSILTEFALLGKPVVSYRGRRPADWVLAFDAAQQLEECLRIALSRPPELQEHLARHGREAHPYDDGKSSERTVDAIESLIERGTEHLAPKPRNWFRRWKMRRRLLS